MAATGTRPEDIGLFGRKRIYTDEAVITKDNVCTVLQQAIAAHLENRASIQYLLNYEKGDQPILSRKKEIRPEINVKVCVNNAAKIVDFKVSYEFGNPIMYTQRSKKQDPASDSDKDDSRVAFINQMLVEEKKSAKDIELARQFKSCGVAYRMIKPKRFVTGKSVVDILNLNPLNTFIIYSNDVYKEPVMAVTYSTKLYGNTVYGCYTKDTYYEIDDQIKIVNSEKTQPNYKVINGNGKIIKPEIIPIVEYTNDFDRMGCFEKVIPIMDAMNIANSDRVNDVAQHVQSILWMHNCELPLDENGVPKKPSSNGLIETSNTDGKQAMIQYLHDVLDQSETQSLIDYLEDEITQIAGVPKLGISNGGSTGSATSLSNGWSEAENRATQSFELFEASEREVVNIILAIMKKSPDIPADLDIESFNAADIEIKAQRSETVDISTKANAFATLVNTGIDALHALKATHIFSDPQQVYNDSKENLDLRFQSTNTTNIAPNNVQTELDNVKEDRLTQDASDQSETSPILTSS